MATDTDDLFMETVKGRYQRSNTISEASFWAPREGEVVNLEDENKKPVPVIGYYVPRPDRNLGTLQNYAFLGFLGLDHFYLRSPATGIAKLLTFGGFGFWWLWDILQVWTEENRVLNYGLSSPFDMQTGIGQGMIYKGKSQSWNYEQNTDFGTWSLATLFGFMGADMFVLGRFWLGFRKLIIFIITMSALAPFFVVLMVDGLWPAIASAGFFGIFWDIFCFMLAIGVFTMWHDDVSKLFNKPDKIMKDGLPVSQTAVDSLGWISKVYLDENGVVMKGLETEWKAVSDHYMFHKQGIIAQELRGRFWIAHKGEYPKAPFTPTPAGIIPFTVGSRIISSIWSGAWDNTVGWAWDQGSNLFSFIYKYAMMALRGVGVVLGLVDSMVDPIPGPVLAAAAAVPPFTPVAPFVIPAKGLLHGVTELLKGKPLTNVASGAVSSLIPGGNLVKKASGLGSLVKGASALTGKGGVGSLVSGLTGKGGVGNLVSGAVGALSGKGGVGNLVSGLAGKGGVGNLVSGLAGSETKEEPVQVNEALVKGIDKNVDSGPEENAREPVQNTNTSEDPSSQQGGARQELSTEAQVMGAVVVALIAGGSLKGLVDYLMTE